MMIFCEWLVEGVKTPSLYAKLALHSLFQSNSPVSASMALIATPSISRYTTFSAISDTGRGGAENGRLNS